MSPASGLNSKKAMYHQYMISRAFIPPWSLAMRDWKLSDQTLPAKAVGTLVSPSIRPYTHVAEKSRKFSTGQLETAPPQRLRLRFSVSATGMSVSGWNKS